MLSRSFDPHLEVWQRVKGALTDAGFKLEQWVSYGYAVPEIPRPALLTAGEFRGLDLSQATASFPHQINMPPAQAYRMVLGELFRDFSTIQGRPHSAWWAGIATTWETSISAIATPLRGGFYGAPTQRLLRGYHVAEFVFLLHRLNPDRELVMGAADFHIELDDGVYGIMDGRILADGDSHPLDHDFDLALLADRRGRDWAKMPVGANLWRAVYAFARQAGLHEDEDFMQALAHARWALPASVTWEDRPYVPRQRGRPAGRLRADVNARALRLEEAYLLLEQLPDLEMRRIRQRLVPAIISREYWNEVIAPITRNKKKRRHEVVECLRQLHAEALQQA